MKHRVFLDLEENDTEDFDEDLHLYVDRNGGLVVAVKTIMDSGYPNFETVAYFPAEIWLYHRLVEEDEPEPIKNYLFYHWNDKYEIDTGHSLVTETKEARYLTEDDGGQTVKDWAVIFEFNHQGFEIVNINDGVSQGTIEMACQAVLAYVVDRLRVVRELKEISKGEEK